MAGITLNNLTKRYPDGFEAVKEMSLEIKDGEFVILVGPVSYTHLTLPTTPYV